MRDVPIAGSAKGRIGLLCAAALCIGVAAAIWADGTVPQIEVYDGLANTVISSGYMNRADYQGSVNSIGTCDVATFSIGSGAASEAPASAHASYFEFFSAYSLESPARGLNSREPCGMIILAR